MRRFKCAVCKIRLSTPGAPAEMVGELCPSCGSLLEPVGTLVEVIGFRRAGRRDDTLGADTAQEAALPRPITPR